MRTPKMGLICLLYLVLGVVQPGLLICVIDDDCDNGYTCLDGICTKCLMCSLLFRNGSSCITDFRKCGDCLEGYEEISVTDFSDTIKPCRPIKRNEKFKDCTSSKSCPPDNYCSEDSCVQCFNCGVVNRLPPVDNCAKGLTECGSCVNGFSEAAVTADTNYTRCEAENFTEQQAVASIILCSSFTVALGVFWFFIFLLRKIRKSRSMHKINSPFNTLPSAPPLQDVDVQQTVFKCPISPLLTTSLTTAKSHACFEREQRQQALVFKQPDASYYMMERERGEGTPVRGSNSDMQPAPCSDSAQQQQQPSSSNLSFETFTPRLNRSQGQDFTDSHVPAYFCPISPLLTTSFTTAKAHACFEREQRQQALVFRQPDASYYMMELEQEVGVPVTGRNSDMQPAPSSDSAQQQQQPPSSNLSFETFTPRLNGSQGQDSTDSHVPVTNEIS